MARSQLFTLMASLVFSLMSCYALEVPQTSLGLNIAKIQKLTGQTGQFDQDQKIYKITVPRDDLKILMSGMQMTPDLGLSSSITFKKTNDQTSVNGDLILLQDQINPVMSVALTNGLQVTGLHNPYLWDSPRVMFMHIIGQGDELQLASAVGKVLKKIKATSNGGGDFPLGSVDFFRTTLSARKIDVILGQKGQFKDDVYKIEFRDGIKPTDTKASKVIALNTWAAFAGSDNEAVVNGTLVLHESELQRVLVKLRDAQIYILAIYHDMINDNQDLVLINFWGIGNTQVLAKALRSVFIIAQNNNPVNITVGEIVPDTSPANTETEIGMTPLQLSFDKKNNCGYVKAKELSTSIDTLLNREGDYAEQLRMTLHMALNLTQKIVLEKMIKYVSFLPATSQIAQSKREHAQVLPSAKKLLLKLSVVSNNVPEFEKLLALKPSITSIESDEGIAISNSTHVSSTVLSTAKNKISKSLTPFAAELAEKLLLLKNNIEVLISVPFISLLTQFTEGTKSLANAIPVILLDIGACFHTYMTKMIVSYIESSESHINSISAFLSSIVTYAYAQLDELLTSSTHLGKLLAHAVSTSVVRGINECTTLYIIVSQSIDHATLSVDMIESLAAVASAVVAEVQSSIHEFVVLSVSGYKILADAASMAVVRDINSMAILAVNVSKSFDAAAFTAIARAYAHINELAALPDNIAKSLIHIASPTIANVDTSIGEFVALSVSGCKLLAHATSLALARDVNAFSALFVNVSHLFDDVTFAAVTRVNTPLNEFAMRSVNISKSCSHVVSAAVARVYANILEFVALSLNGYKVLAHATSFAIVRDINAFSAISGNVSHSFDYATFVAVTRVNTHLNEFAMLSINLSKSFAHVTSAAAACLYVNLHEFVVLSVSGCKILAHATSSGVVRDINAFTTLPVKVSHLFDYATFVAVACVNTHLNEFAMRSVNLSKSFAHITSTAVARVYANIYEFGALSVSRCKVLTHTASLAIVRDINAFSAVSVKVSHLFDYATFVAATRVNTHLNEFAMLSVHLSKSLANIATTTVIDRYANIHKFVVFSVNISQVLAHSTYFALLKVTDFADASATDFITSLAQSFSLVKNTMLQLVQFSANKTVILLAAMKKPVPNPDTLTAQNTMSSLLPPLSMPANISAESILKSRLPLSLPSTILASISPLPDKNNLSDALITILAVDKKNAADEMTPPASKPSVAVIEAENKIPSMLKPLIKILSPISLPPPVSPASPVPVQAAPQNAVDVAKRVEKTLDKMMQVTPKAVSLIPSVKEAEMSKSEKTLVKVPPRSMEEIKNKVIEVAKAPPEKNLFLPLPHPGSKTIAEMKPTKKMLTADLPVMSDHSHDPIVKSLSAVLPVSPHKIIPASSKKIVPASLPMPQNQVIRVATLSTLSSVIPITHHKVKPIPGMQSHSIKVNKLSTQSLPYPHSSKDHPVTKINLLTKPLAPLKQTKAAQYREQSDKLKTYAATQHKNMKLAKLSLSPLLHVQSISNHNVSRIKPIANSPASFRYTKIGKHSEQPNKKLLITLHPSHPPHTKHALNRAVTFPVVHHVNHQLVRRVARKPHVIAHTMLHEENWNTEKLAPEPSVLVAQQHVYREQEEFDDGPALVGTYPYDEEPADGGFG